MKPATLLAICAVLTGCNQSASTTTYPPTTGDFVKTSAGSGTAKVWGISFDVAQPVGELGRSYYDGCLSSDPEQTDARVEIMIGDDVEIRLEKVPASPITLEFNGKSYGTLAKGDKVSIGKERGLTVNGSLREAGPRRPSITKANIEAIKEGMTLNEVESLLGKGLDKAPADLHMTAKSGVEPEFCRWWWNGQHGMVLGFRGGKVVGIGGK